MEQLTVKEALEQGYEHFGHSNESGWICMHDIKDSMPIKFRGTERLFNKELEPAFQVTSDMVKDILIDRLSNDWDSESGDDTGEMYDFLYDIPVEKFNEIVVVLNEAMANKHSYKLTKIKLVE